MLKKIIGQWKNIKEPQVIDWLFFGSIALLCFISFGYNDFIVTAHHSVALWDTQGYNYYSKATEMTGVMAVYPFLLYLIFGIWGFPAYLSSKIQGKIFYGGTGPEGEIFGLGTVELLWMKVLLILLLLLTAYLIFSILRDAGVSKKNSKWAVFFFLTSLFPFLIVFLINHYDILYIPFILLGIRAFNRQKENEFFWYFCASIAIKSLSIAIYIPLLLLIEKNIYRIAIKVAGALSMVLIPSLLFHILDPGYAYVSKFSMNLIIDMLNYPLLPQISFFLSGFFAICVFAYMAQPKSEEYLIYAAYVATASSSLIVLVGIYHFWWAILLSPFMVILIFLNPARFKINIIIELIASLGCMLFAAYKYTGTINIVQFYYINIIPKLFPITSHRPYINLSSLIPRDISSYFHTMFLIGLVLFLVINYPPSLLRERERERERERVLS